MGPGATRPFVRINFAMSTDGRIAAPGGHPLTLSGPEDFARVHRMRHESDAILVGVGTILHDDPSLLTKAEHVPNPRHPLRVVLDSQLRTPHHARVLDGRAPTVVYTKHAHGGAPLPGAEVRVAGDREVGLPRVLEDLHSTGIASVMVEGGARVIGSFLREGLWDEMTVYVAPVVVGPGAPSFAESDGLWRDGPVPLTLHGAERLGVGLLLTYRPGRVRHG